MGSLSTYESISLSAVNIPKINNLQKEKDKMKYIYFMGRYTGHGIYRFFPFYKENYRPSEIKGISNSKNIRITNNTRKLA